MELKLIPADKFDTLVTAFTTKINSAQLQEITQSWITNQGKHWPADLTAKDVLPEIKLVHLPYWGITATAVATWYAGVGVDHQVLKRCGTCDGRGRHTPIWSSDERRCDNCAGSGKALSTETFWTNQSGHAATKLDGVLKENFHEDTLKLKCGKRDFKANWAAIQQNQASALQVVSPLSTDKTAGAKVANETILKSLEYEGTKDAYGLGSSVRNLKLANVQVQQCAVEACLYPMYLGFYSYGDEQIPFQADAVTGKAWGDVPQAVKSKRMGEFFKWTIIVLLIIAAAIGVVTLYNRLIMPPNLPGAIYNGFQVDKFNFDVSHVNFFASTGAESLSKEKRFYQFYFLPETACVNAELNLSHEKPKEKMPFSYKVEWFNPANFTIYHSTMDTYVLSDWESSYHTHSFCGVGGNWMKGVYRVQISVAEQVVATGYFAIHDDKFWKQ
jgi:hypothetical protein